MSSQYSTWGVPMGNSPQHLISVLFWGQDRNEGLGLRVITNHKCLIAGLTWTMWDSFLMFCQRYTHIDANVTCMS